MRLSKGENAPLAALGEQLRATLRWPAGTAEADCSALLCTGDGKVVDDEHFVFYNAPASPDGSVIHEGKTAAAGSVTDTLTLDLSAVAARIERIIIAASTYDASFASLGGPASIEVTGSAGAGSIVFEIADATTETALLFAEVYRRSGQWKVRAVGQGYAGLAGLATDFGVSIADDASDNSEAADGSAPAGSSGPNSPIGIDWRTPPVPAGYEMA
jgi:tellurite resistance protein TerA